MHFLTPHYPLPVNIFFILTLFRPFLIRSSLFFLFSFFLFFFSPFSDVPQAFRRQETGKVWQMNITSCDFSRLNPTEPKQQPLGSDQG